MKKKYTIFAVWVNYQFQCYWFINCNKIFSLSCVLKQKDFKKNQPSSLQNFKNQLDTSSRYPIVLNSVQDVASSLISTSNKAQWFSVISINPP
jgi:hypothetical protein